MITKCLLIASAALIFLNSCLFAQQRSQSSKAQSRQSIDASCSQGSLGRPFGTILTVAGKYITGVDTHRKADEGKVLLRIETVNQKALLHPVELPLELFEGVTIDTIRGNRFRLIGYETGGFTGIPSKAFQYIPQSATEDFHFETRFVVLKNAAENLH